MLQGRLITLCTDSSLHLWQINSSDEECSTVDVVASCTVAVGKWVYILDFASCWIWNISQGET